MYCGTNKIALSSQKQIMDALLSLLSEKNYAEISVSELCRKAQVSRQTFYSLYESKENIIIDLLQSHGYAPDDSSDAETFQFNLSAFCSQFSTYLKENTSLLTMLFKNGILYLLYDSFYDSIANCSFFMTEAPIGEREYTASFIASGFMGITRTYILHNGTDSREYLKEKIMSLFRGEYLPTEK
ncbi:MAG: TetR/AcrR family transcriptional regulator [Lachnospiraceae bacterium]|nr:TetR/AcrR family transcriptional regulator [Lachnospiraceae bacterium]